MRLIIFLSIVFFISCFNPRILQTEEPFFSMQRTACYGTCPQYRISIYHHGKITYNGKLFVDKIGIKIPCRWVYTTISKLYT